MSLIKEIGNGRQKATPMKKPLINHAPARGRSQHSSKQDKRACFLRGRADCLLTQTLVVHTRGRSAAWGAELRR